jgi:phosphatidylethanolamine N-methyltransferase
MYPTILFLFTLQRCNNQSPKHRYYGYALISQSYVVFGLALFSHLMQMAFLVFVETPHIEKIYGSPPNLANKSSSNIMLIRNFDIFRSSDLSLLLVVCLTVAMFVLGMDYAPLTRTCGGTATNGEACLDTPWIYRGTTYNSGKGTCILNDHADWWCYTRKDLSAWGECNCGKFGMYVVVGHVVVWRVLKTLVSGFVLSRQAQSKWWTNKFNGNDRAAFESWKKLSNLLTTMCGVSYMIAAYYLYEPLDSSTAWSPIKWTPAEIFYALFGFMMIWLNHWSNCEVEAAIGEFGWFFGDYFTSNPDGIDQSGVENLSYSGIFKFFNNPDALFGFAGFYGIALLCHSWTLAILSAFAQLLNLIFVHNVEIPHAKEVYKNRYRPNNPTMRRVKSRVDKVKRKVKQFRDRAESTASDMVELAKRTLKHISPPSSPSMRARRRNTRNVSALS